ncbi:MAG: filamentous hemagglutinin N-terminal domain-containing protein [Verrucomicrobiae bacterium]|nr:filamentous hemagglutinin N-terminal domain-containing protein [Verrucomicrobiae bacterium]
MKALFRSPQSLFIAALVFMVGRASTAFANPTGLSVSAGSASAHQVGSQLNVTVGQLAVLNWQSFNIQKGETTSFLQPSAGSIVFNVIGGANPSQIFGNLNANGTVILANANGFYFGPDSMIKVGGSFIATTAGLPPDFGSGAAWQFTGTPPLASIINYGQIEVGAGKSLYLIAEKIENHGSLSAPQGDAELLAGDNVLVSERPDGRGLSASVQMPDGSVDNFGRITADAGTIALQARVVNQEGTIQADSIAEKNGFIELVASDALNLGADSRISAAGDPSVGGSAGGDVVLKSQNIFGDADGSSIVTTGGAQGGNGGNIELSAPNIQSFNSAMDATAQPGFLGGSLLLDPVNIILGTSGGGSVPANGTVLSTDNGNGADAGGTLNLNVNTAFKNKHFSNIQLQASGSIYIGNGSVDANGVFTPAASPTINWNLSNTTGLTDGQLTLQAGGDITFCGNSKIIDANNWSVSLFAGYNFTSHSVNDGTGNIFINGGPGLSQLGSIQLGSGDLNLFASQSILVGSGSLFTAAGGNIFAYAAKGDINAGTANGSDNGFSQTSDFTFGDDGTSPNNFLGGIGTAAGGNVTLIAGNNIDSTPTVPSKQAPGASGAYGPGDVTVIAGKQITGNFNLTDGVGTMLAGVKVTGAQAIELQNMVADPTTAAATLTTLEQAVKQNVTGDGNIGSPPANGSPSTVPVTLDLTSGSWNVWAANDISIKQVVNPNGAFNDSQSFAFNYAPDAAANFWAGNAIELVGGSFGAVASSIGVTPIYAPSLSLNAGAGGIIIDKGIILAPSSQGALSLITRNGGNLTGAIVLDSNGKPSTVLNGITMSDSASGDYTTFSSEHDNIHLNDPNVAADPKFKPVYLDVSGSIGSFSLSVPTFADLTVESTQPYLSPDDTLYFGTYNFGFKGRNLSASQTTSINVWNKISYRGALTVIDLTPVQLADLLPAALFNDSADRSITDNLIYDATTGKLVFVGAMSQAQLTFLLSPKTIVRDQNGNPVLQPAVNSSGDPIVDDNGNPTYTPVTQPLTLDATQQGMIRQLYAASQSASLGDQGLFLAGPGNFNVHAGSMDIGVSGGIRVLAPDAGLQAVSPLGAHLNVSTAGDLAMASTKIANESYLGDVNVTVGGNLDVGSQFSTLGDPSAAKGIFSTSSGDVAVVANGNVNVNGSRIAAYNGGSVTVASLTGDVNAGNGGAGYVTLKAFELDPLTGLLTGIPAQMPGSGILATTVPRSHASLGNILVEAPLGKVAASVGGILQISFNGADASKAVTYVLAGYELRDASDANLLYAQDLSAAFSLENNPLPGSDNLFDGSGSLIGRAVYASASRDIDAGGSGVIAQSITARATGEINGLFIGHGAVDIAGRDLGKLVIFTPGPISLSGKDDPNAGGPVIISATDPTVNGISTPQEAPQSNVAKDNSPTADDAAAAVSKTTAAETDGGDDFSKKKKGIALAQKISRVTVLLPKKD